MKALHAYHVPFQPAKTEVHAGQCKTLQEELTAEKVAVALTSMATQHTLGPTNKAEG